MQFDIRNVLSIKKSYLPITLSILANLQLLVFVLNHRDWGVIQFIIGHSAALFIFVLLFFPIILFLTHHAYQLVVNSINVLRQQSDQLNIAGNF